MAFSVSPPPGSRSDQSGASEPQAVSAARSGGFGVKGGGRADSPFQARAQGSSPRAGGFGVRDDAPSSSAQGSTPVSRAGGRPAGSAPVHNSGAPQRLDAEAIVAQTDIVGLIGEVVDLVPRRNQFAGLCPFHGDSNPSFMVNPEKGTYACWSCSAGINGKRGGDAVHFVQRYYELEYIDALVFLARRAGLPIPDRYTSRTSRAMSPEAQAYRPQVKRVIERSEHEPNLTADKGPLYAAMDKAQNIFAAELKSNQQVMSYLIDSRKVDPAMLARYRIGYAPDGFNTLRSKFADYDVSRTLLDAGLINEKLKEDQKRARWDFFRDRLMFGVCDEKGRIVAFGGRRLSDKEKVLPDGRKIPVPKYLNSPETAIFSKIHTLFGLFEGREDMRKSGYALVVEGYMDVVGLASRGIGNAAACMGTSLSSDHARMLYDTVDRVVLSFDGDRAGMEAAVRSLAAVFPYLDGTKDVSFITIPEEKDPDEYVIAYGAQAFHQMVSKAKSLHDVWESSLSLLYDTSTDAGKNHMWAMASELISKLPENSPYTAHLTQIAARLAGKAEKKSSVMQQRRALRTFVVNEPSDRLFLAVLRCPDVATEVLGSIPVVAARFGADLQPVVAEWKAKFEQALAAGRSVSVIGGVPATPVELRQYEAVVRAAPSILDQFVRSYEVEAVNEQWKLGQMDETSYLSKVSRSTLAKPV